MSTKTVTPEAMQAILTKLEDVHNSQAALNQKLAVIQMAVEDAPDDDLEASLAEAYGNANKNAELIRAAIHQYEMTLNAQRMAGN